MGLHTLPHVSHPWAAQKPYQGAMGGNCWVLTAMVEPQLQAVGTTLTPEDQTQGPPHLSEPERPLWRHTAT